MRAAHRALLLGIHPFLDTICMEVMAWVARQRSDRIAVYVLNSANSALLHPFITFIELLMQQVLFHQGSHSAAIFIVTCLALLEVPEQVFKQGAQAW